MNDTLKNIERRVKLAKIHIAKGITELEKAQDLAYTIEMNGTAIRLTKDLESIQKLSIYE